MGQPKKELLEMKTSDESLAEVRAGKIWLEKEDLSIQPLPVKVCTRCYSAAASHFIQIDFRELVVRSGLADHYCRPCAEQVIDLLRSTINGPSLSKEKDLIEMSFEFGLSQIVVLKHSKEKAVVIARAEFTNSCNSYLLRYEAGDGRQVEVWWSEDALQAEFMAEHEANMRGGHDAS